MRAKGVAAELEPYRDGMEHLADELACLDIGLRTLLGTSGGDPLADPLAASRGLFVTEGELLAGERDPAASAEWQAFAAYRKEKEGEIAHRVRLGLMAGAELPLAALAVRLRLTVWECRCVVLCLAIELDRKYEKWFGYLNDDVTCRTATPDLALRLLCDSAEERLAARALLAGDGALRRLLLEPAAEASSPSRSRLKDPLRLDERTVSYLLGAEALDARLADAVEAYEDADEANDADEGPSDAEEADPAWRLLKPLAEERSGRPELPFVHLWGPLGGGKLLRLRRLAARRGQRLLAVRLGLLPAETEELKLALRRIVREAAFTDAVLVFAEDRDAAPNAPARGAEFRSALRDYEAFAARPLVGWIGAERRRREELPVPDSASYRGAEVGVPDARARAEAWLAARLNGAADARGSADVGGDAHAGERADVPDGDGFAALARELGDKYRFTPGQIERAWREAALLAEVRGGDAPSREDLEAASRKQYRHRLDQLADRIEPVRGWPDLVLPPEPLGLLREACGRFLYRETVLNRWGFRRKLPYGTGVHLLFAGPPGTGKTMAAEVVAKELGLELYRIDLSRIVSKYIGETEQRLKELFDEADQSGAILFFDEGDALFGKRTEVKDAHDRYANLEAAYLLQRIEAYDGVTILATNLMQNLDEALLRRMSVVVKFPFPDAADRERIIRAHLPAEAPLADDLDLAFLAARLDVSGGHIKNVALAAAFLAASEGTPIGMSHFVRAARQELRKMGKILVKEAFAPYFDEIYEYFG